MKHPATILLVEDDRSMLDGIYDLLSAVDIGFDLQVMTAGNGQIALDKMSQETPNLIVSDIMMPQMDGYQFLRNVRTNPDWVHIPFIFLTAKGEKRDIHEGRLSGADLYLVKPFNSSELLDLIQAQLTRSFRLTAARQETVETLKKDILQILNHEFRTPLTYVTAYYEMLADGVERFSGQQNFHEYLRGIQAGCVRLTKLVEDLITVIEVRTGEAQADFDEHAEVINDLDALIEAAVEDARPRATAKGLVFELAIGAPVPAVYGSRSALRDLLGRLLDNAVKFTPQKSCKGKVIRISAEAAAGEVRLAVSDSGIGFPMRLSNEIFEMFYQHNRDTMEQQGPGVGLTIARGIAEMHGGRIEVESQEGSGSTFSVFLPRHDADGSRGERRAGAVREATILVVEDDPNLLEGLQELLYISSSKYEYRTLAAENGLKGLEVLESHHPDLIISDIMMPQMGGLEFLEAVRKNSEWFQIPFIFLTAKGERKEIHQGLKSGAEEYITKPYDSDELLQLVASQLDRHFQVQGAVAQSFDSLKRSILSLITPDFRLPLSSVSQYSEKLAIGFEQAQTEEQLKESLTGIQASSRNLARLVEEFIAFAELRTGEAQSAFELRAQPVHDLGYLLHESVQIWAGQIDATGARIDYQMADLPAVYGDSGMILRALQHLLDVGLRNFPLSPDDVIKLVAGVQDGALAIELRFPHGPAADVLESLRHRLKSGESEIDGYSEVVAGLFIANGYIELHGGSSDLKETTPAGCTFSISLPVYTGK